jgi:hypothetical protein
MKKHFLTLGILLCAAFYTAAFGFAQQLAESSPGTIDLAAPRLPKETNAPDAPPPLTVETGGRELDQDEIDRRKTYIEYAAHKDGYSTAHLKPYTGFSLGLPVSSISMGLSTNSPIGVGDYFSPNSDWKKDGYLMLDFSRIARETDGVGLDFAFRVNMALFELSGQAKRQEKSGGEVSYSYKQWQKDYKEDKKYPLIDSQAQFKTPKPTKDPNYIYSDWGWSASLLKMDVNVNVGLSDDVVKFIGSGNGEDMEFAAGLDFSTASFLETLSFTLHKEHIGMLETRGGGLDLPTLKNVYISLGIAHYEPILYVPPSTLNAVVDMTDPNNEGDTVLYARGKVRAYSAANPRDIAGSSYFGGIDLTINAEYNFKELGMPFWDVGTTITHLPLIPAVVTTAIEKDVDEPIMRINGGKAINGGDAITSEIDTFISHLLADDGQEIDVKKTILRPLRWDFYTLLRPLQMLRFLEKSPDFFVVRANIGFTALFPAEKVPSKEELKIHNGNEYYSFNWGVGGDFNFGRWFTLSVATGSYDGLIHNTLGLDFHWYMLPVFIIADFSAVDNNKPQDYENAWSITGATIKFGAHWAF